MNALLVVYMMAALPTVEPPVTVEATENAAADFPGAPRLQSFAFAQWQGKWVLIAGRANGYHGTGAEEVDFPRAKANQSIWVVDASVHPAKTYSFPLDKLPARLGAVRDQFSSTNPLYEQDGSTLYLAGGYGQTASGEWMTHDLITAVDLPSLVNGVMRGEDTFSGRIRFGRNPAVQSTGGELIRLPDGMYVVMGHVFTGRYTDFTSGGEKNTAKVSQEYLSEIRRIKVEESGGALNVTLLEKFSDPEYHRRDLNVAHAIQPDGALGIGVYGGVFTPGTQLNYTKPVYIAGGKPSIDRSFDQKMSAYTCAKLLLYDRARGAMLSTFFGGISRHAWDANEQRFVENPITGSKSDKVYHDGLQWSDQVSTLVRSKQSTVEFVQRKRLPGFVGSNAVFIPREDLARAVEGTSILDLEPLKGKRTFAGYIYGGIRAFPYKFPYTPEGRPYSSGTVPTRPSDMILKVFVTVPAK